MATMAPDQAKAMVPAISMIKNKLTECMLKHITSMNEN
jgi:hypothetical protein